ncbi:hypothetical protein ACFYTS_18705 [Nocardia sp. NPDC004151]|uniref:hypothetical protein n=1 Tax=Nocardia sp. NPDC004151 TaxID=3364304 RepID=UPI0036B0FDA3
MDSARRADRFGRVDHRGTGDHSGSYGAVYPTAAVVSTLGALAVLPIKSVR